jgi:hypothetical protein
VVGIVAYRAAELGREDDAVSAPFERFAHHYFRLAVHVRRVDKIDPRVQRPVDDADRVVVVRVADGRAERECA